MKGFIIRLALPPTGGTLPNTAKMRRRLLAQRFERAVVRGLNEAGIDSASQEMTARWMNRLKPI